MIETRELLDLQHSLAGEFLKKTKYPWEILEDIGKIILVLGEKLPEEEYDHPQPDVWISKKAKVFPSSYIAGPCIIESGAEIRHCAFIRGSALVGKDCVVGNSTELKNVILFDEVQVPHFNYVGDSVLGFRSHMGAGAITSNVKGNKTLIEVHCGKEKMATGRKKFGAILGDAAEIGCNAVLNPGTIVGKNSQVYPLVSVRGVAMENSIVKSSGEIVQKEERVRKTEDER